MTAQLSPIALVAGVLAACSASERSVTKATGGGSTTGGDGGSGAAQAGGAGGGSGASNGGASGGGGDASGSNAGGTGGVSSVGCDQCKCGQFPGPCGPAGNPLVCTIAYSHCCYCPVTCTDTPACKPSADNPIGGFNWWCCEEHMPK